jgi:hypothetical protein
MSKPQCDFITKQGRCPKESVVNDCGWDMCELHAIAVNSSMSYDKVLELYRWLKPYIASTRQQAVDEYREKIRLMLKNDTSYYEDIRRSTLNEVLSLPGKVDKDELADHLEKSGVANTIRRLKDE